MTIPCAWAELTHAPRITAANIDAFLITLMIPSCLREGADVAQAKGKRDAACGCAFSGRFHAEAFAVEAAWPAQRAQAPQTPVRCRASSLCATLAVSLHRGKW